MSSCSFSPVFFQKFNLESPVSQFFRRYSPVTGRYLHHWYHDNVSFAELSEEGVLLRYLNTLSLTQPDKDLNIVYSVLCDCLNLKIDVKSVHEYMQNVTIVDITYRWGGRWIPQFFTNICNFNFQYIYFQQNILCSSSIEVLTSQILGVDSKILLLLRGHSKSMSPTYHWFSTPSPLSHFVTVCFDPPPPLLPPK